MASFPAQVVLSAGHEREPVALVAAVQDVRLVQPDAFVTATLDPPADLVWLWRLHQAGANAVAIDVMSLDEGVRRRLVPETADLTLRRYDAAWSEAVRLFGRGRVSTRLALGAGEDTATTERGCRRLRAMGVEPVDAGSVGGPEPRPPTISLILGSGSTLRNCPTCGALTGLVA